MCARADYREGFRVLAEAFGKRLRLWLGGRRRPATAGRSRRDRFGLGRVAGRSAG